MVDFAQLAVLAAITGGTPIIIALLPASRRQLGERATHLMLGLSAGILLGISLVDIFPEAFEASVSAKVSPHLVSLGAAGGFFALLLIERVLIARGEAGSVHFENGRRIQPFGTLAMSALTVHGLLDGFVIPLGFAVSSQLGTVVAFAVAIHQIPDSFAAASVGLASNAGRKRVFAYVFVTAADTPIGILLGAIFTGVAANLIVVGLAFSAGTFIFVSAADLIPELQHRSRSSLVVGSILLGFAIVAALTIGLPPS